VLDDGEAPEPRPRPTGSAGHARSAVGETGLLTSPQDRVMARPRISSHRRNSSTGTDFPHLVRVANVSWAEHHRLGPQRVSCRASVPKATVDGRMS
jgi:hypothetical protein